MAWTRFRSPVPALDAGWERAGPFLEQRVRQAVTQWKEGEGVPDGSASRDAVRAARALLAMGERDAPKDLVRIAGLALARRLVAPPLLPSLQRLLADFRRWTGDQAFVERYREGLGQLDRLPDPPPEPPMAPGLDHAAPEELVERVAGHLFGVLPEAMDARLAVVAALPRGWREMELTGLRVGPTSLDLRVRRASMGIVLRVSRTHGPRLRLEASLREAIGLTRICVDDEPLGAPRAILELAGEHEVRFEVG